MVSRRTPRRQFESLEPRQLLAAQPIISEFMASNQGSLVDDLGSSSDWIELYNAGDEAADLQGWYLTDDLAELDKWRFPAVSLGAGEYLLVFASGRDQRDAASPLHTNFRLSAQGESLALVQPDGETIASRVGEAFPRQLPDVSFGVAMEVSRTPLVGPGSTRQVLVPNDDRLGTTWQQTNFQPGDDWRMAPGVGDEQPFAIGYERGELPPDAGQYASVVLADRPQGYWRLDETRGSRAQNLGSLGTQADGSYQEQPRQGLDGVLPGALDHAVEFRQVASQKIDVPYQSGLNPRDFTVELWARLDGGSGYRSPLTSRGNLPQTGFLLYATPGNSWEFWTGSGVQATWNIVRGSAVELGSWTHLVGTYDSASQQQVLYVNGIEVGRINAVYTPNDVHPLRIGGGASEGPGSYFFEGAIDEVAVYDQALSADRIAAHYQQGRPLPAPVERQTWLAADFANPGPAALGADAARLVLAGHSPESPTLVNPDGRLLMPGGGTGTAVFTEALRGLTFEHPLLLRTQAGWDAGAAPSSDANAYFGLVALHRQGTGPTGAARKGGVFAQAQPRQDGSVDLRLGFQTASTGALPDTLVVTSSQTVAAGVDPNARLQLELEIDGLNDADTMTLRVRQPEVLAELKSTIGGFRQSLVNGSSAQQAFDAVLSELRQDPGLMNVGLISTRPFGAAADNVDAYDDFEVSTLAPSAESPVADYADQLQTDLGAVMFQRNASAYLRIPFQVGDPSALDQLLLSLQYDDGYVAYLNGQEIARGNAPASIGWNARATATRPDTAALVPEVIDVTAHLANLRPGPNVLAIQGLNQQPDNADFLLAARLEALQTRVLFDSFRYYGSPSPGRANSDEGAPLGPVVEEVRHAPAQPLESDEILVTARLAEASEAAGTLTLTYRVMYEDERALPMRDDGRSPDAVAADGVYTAAIPRGVARPGEMLRYFVTARDDAGYTFRSPYLPPAAPADGQPLYYGTVIQDATVDTPLPVFSWFVPDPGWHIAGGGNNQNWSPAAVYYDGQFYDNVRVRVRGLTTVNWAKPKFKFEFNDGYEFRYAPDQPPVEEFNLQSHYLETGAVSYMGETLAFQWLREIGVPAPRAFHMHVRQNGTFYSLASFVEQIDQTFLERNGFDPTGAMYKANSAAVRSTLRPNPTPADYLKVTRKDEPFDDLVELTNGINNRLAGVDRSTYLFDVINLPEVINDMAGNVIMPNHDRLTKNYYMHLDVNGNGEWSRFPWDMDQAFARFTVDHFASVLYGDSEHPQSPDPVHQNHLYDAILDTPATRQMYLRRVRTLFDEYLATGYFEREVDRYHLLLADDAARDQAKWRAGDIRNGVARIKSNVGFRRQQLEAEGLLPASDFTTDRVVLLEQDAAVEVLVPQDGTLGEGWTGGAEPFDTTGWLLGTSGVGFDNGSNPIFLPEINTLVEPQQVCAACTSIYTRYRFQVDDATAFDVLTLQMKFDDGFVAYLNGQQVWRQNVPAAVDWDSVASSSSVETTDFVDFDISAARHALRPGENVLAIHTLNASRVSNDMLVRPRLWGGRKQHTNLSLQFGEVEFDPASGDQNEEFIQIVNTGAAAVDVSGWRISGGIEFRFQAGTVIPANSSLYVSPDVRAFRARSTGPTGGQGLFVQGNYAGHLSNLGQTLQLITAEGRLVATHTTPAVPTDVQRYLRVSELHYHPARNEDAEFIELTNISRGDLSTTLDLTGVSISQGPSEPFVFAAGTRLEPGDTLLVVRDLDALLLEFPGVDRSRVAGVFTGRLNNAGEQIQIDDRDGSLVLQFVYQDRHPWPAAADGQGASLQLLDPSAPPDDPRQWAAAAPTPARLLSRDADLNQDGRLDEADIARLCQALAAVDMVFDLNGDDDVDTDDVQFYVQRMLGTQVGDANLDGRFDSSDLVLVLAAGEFEDRIDGNSTWAEGDWNCDGEFNTSDLVFALQSGGFQ
jgi:hypothetical protein